MATFLFEVSLVEGSTGASDDEVAAVVTAMQALLMSEAGTIGPQHSRWALAGRLEAQSVKSWKPETTIGWNR
jgi:hypothetical protein